MYYNRTPLTLSKPKSIFQDLKANPFLLQIVDYVVLCRLSCSFCMCPAGGPKAASDCQTAAGPSLGDERLQQPCGVVQQAAGMDRHTKKNCIRKLIIANGSVCCDIAFTAFFRLFPLLLDCPVSIQVIVL